MRKFDETIAAAKTITPTLEGRSFTLVMSHPTGNPSANKTYRDYHIVPRDRLPCWGELRKYKDTHGDLYTRQEDDYHPRDLYQPFPSGVPCAVIIGLQNWGHSSGEKSKEFIDFLKEVIYEGPWAPDFSKDSFSFDKDCLTVYCGDTLKGLRFDSTAFVSFLSFVTSMSHKKYLDWYFETRKFLSVREAVLSAISNKQNPSGIGIQSPYEYYFSNISVKLILEGRHNGLSEGSFGDGFDYNRKKLHNVFSAKKPDLGYDPAEFFSTHKEALKANSQTYVYKDITCEDYCRIFKEGMLKALEEEEKFEKSLKAEGEKAKKTKTKAKATKATEMKDAA